MKSVALVGFAQSSLIHAKESEADEMWSVNFAWNYAVPRIDRLFEIHPLWYLAQLKGERDKKHLKWLQTEKEFPIYTYADFTQKRTLAEVEIEPYLSLMEEKGVDPQDVIIALQKYKRAYKKRIAIPSSVPYPFEKAYRIFNNIKRGKEGKPSIYFTSTLSYMAALAIIQEFDLIELYGVEMSIGSEYVYQKAGLEMLLGYAAGKGIKIRLTEHSKLLNSRLYHEGAQMISRTACETHQGIYHDKMNAFISERNILAGQMNDMVARNASEEEIKELAEKVQMANNNMFFHQGARDAMRNAVKEIDTDNPVIELINKISLNEIGSNNHKQEKSKNGKPKRRKRNRGKKR